MHRSRDPSSTWLLRSYISTMWLLFFKLLGTAYFCQLSLGSLKRTKTNTYEENKTNSFELSNFGSLKKYRKMLGLEMPTDPRWVNIVEKNISEILTDHAWCEQKAASAAISLIVRFPEYPDLVNEMTALAREEMEHFSLVHEKIKERGYKLGFDRKDPYVKDLAAFIKKGGDRKQQLVEGLLMAGMIEARSCERFRVLSEEIDDADLRMFYRGLMASEARHYTTFLRFARKYGGNIDVDKRWKEFLTYEGKLMEKYGKSETIHG